ncbi:MAG: hypothetical protein LBB53_00395 [Prevotellaceae bacterium]|jgi:hypothetical protein|nr:hypothetical protein [Prevotellaceae bacterium]
MKKNILILLLYTLFFTAISAQKNDTLVRNIQIEKDYMPEVAPVSRPDILLETTEPNIEKPSVSFSKFSVPFDVEKGDFLPISPEKLTAVDREKSKSGFLRLGFGPLFTWLADVWYPVQNSKDGYFDIGFRHDAVLGVVKPTKKLINTGLTINFNKNFNEHQFYLAAKYDNEFFNYYGQDSTYSRLPKEILKLLDSQYGKQAFNKADFTVGARSSKRTDTGWLYNAYLNYHLHNANGNMGKLSENNINAAVRADIEWEKHHLDVEAGAQVYFYNVPQGYGLWWKPNTVIKLLPAYLLNSEKIHLRLGIKTFFNFNKGAFLAISPDVKLDYFYKDFLNLYIGITGDYHINSLANITAENRYYTIINPTTRNTYTPMDIFGGFKVKITKGLMLNAFLNYKYVNDKIFFVNRILYLRSSADDVVQTEFYQKTFSPASSTGTLFNAGIRINYDIKEQINIFAQMKYSGWNLNKSEISDFSGTSSLEEKIAWHVPALEVNAGSEFKIGKGFFGSVNLYCASKPKALRDFGQITDNQGNTTANIYEIISLPATFDLNLGAGYNIKKNVSFFVQANNILALSPKLNYQNWYGYNSFGAHLLAGITVLF